MDYVVALNSNNQQIPQSTGLGLSLMGASKNPYNAFSK
jgi:hypothetical protein